MTASLFLLVGYFGVAVIQLIVQWVHLLDRRGGEMWVHILLAFALLKIVLILAAMLSFAIGVVSYRLPAVRQDAEPADGRSYQ